MDVRVAVVRTTSKLPSPPVPIIDAVLGLGLAIETKSYSNLLEVPMKTLTRSLLIGSLALIASLKTQAAVDDESPLAAQAVPLLYVANATDSGGGGPGFVSAYDPGSCGSVSPILTIRGTNTLIDDAQTLAFDKSGHLFVQNFIGGDAKTLIFPPQANGNVAPIRSFSGNTGARDNLSIAIDSKGYVFIVRRESPPSLQVFPPGASGSVPPLRTVSFDGAPISVAIDDEDEVIVGVNSSTLGNAIEVFAPQAQGSPKRIIRGSNTGLGGNDGTVPTVAFSPLNERIYVGVSTQEFLGGGTSKNPNGHISVFPSDGNGNITPVRTISGTQTGLNGTGIYGIAGNPHTGDIFVMTNPSPFFAPGSVIVFARLANGNVLPLRLFTDSTTGFAEAVGIAFSPIRQ
jgi:hypothetical protein